MIPSPWMHRGQRSLAASDAFKATMIATWLAKLPQKTRPLGAGTVRTTANAVKTPQLRNRTLSPVMAVEQHPTRQPGVTDAQEGFYAR